MKTEQPREGKERKKERERKAPLIGLEPIAEPTGKRQSGPTHVHWYWASQVFVFARYLNCRILTPSRLPLRWRAYRPLILLLAATHHLLLISGNAAVIWEYSARKVGACPFTIGGQGCRFRPCEGLIRPNIFLP